MMQQYYLSYIEVGGHAALMLSFQEDINKPVQIVYEVGFGPAPDTRNEDRGFFTFHTGHVREEQNASRALYSSASVRHKTYPISKEELNRFFAIINEDKKKNLSKIIFNPEEEDPNVPEISMLVSGERYQLLRYNCKVYALSVFKRMGIVEAKNLENIFIQQPRTTPTLLEDLTHETLSCPVKETFSQNLMLALTKAEKDLSRLLAEKNNLIFNDDETTHKGFIVAHENSKANDYDLDIYYHAQFFRLVEEARNHCIALRKNSHKAGIDANFEKQFVTLCNLLDKIEKVKKAHTSISTTPPLNEKKFDAMLATIDAHANETAHLYDSLLEIEAAYENESLEMLWKTSPKLSTRLQLDTFNDTEKAVYMVTAKTNEIIDELAFLSTLISKTLKTTKNDKGFSEDLLEMKRLIEEAQQELHQDDVHFAALVQNKNDDVCRQACADQTSIINRVTHDLEEALSSFKPRSTNSSWFVAFFIQLLNLFKQEPYIKDFNAGQALSRKVSSLKEKSKKYDFNLNPTFSRKRKEAFSPISKPTKDLQQKKKITPPRKRPDTPT